MVSGMGKTLSRSGFSFYYHMLSAQPCTSTSNQGSQTIHCRENQQFPKRELCRLSLARPIQIPAPSLTKRPLCHVFSCWLLVPYCLQCFLINLCLKFSPPPNPTSVSSAPCLSALLDLVPMEGNKTFKFFFTL